VLADISEGAHALQLRHAQAWLDLVQPALADAGHRGHPWDELGDDDRKNLYDYFQAQVFPVLMPLAVDPAHPSPTSRALAEPRDPHPQRQDRSAGVRAPQGAADAAAVRRGAAVGRRRRARYLPLEQLIANHLGDLFPGMEILEHHTFRLTRNEDVVIEEDETENLIQALEAELLRRRFGPPIRLE
jgi:polyphosphate kinase